MSKQVQVQVRPHPHPAPQQKPPPCTDKIKRTWFREEDQ